MNAKACKAAIMLMAVNQRKQQRILAQLPAAIKEDVYAALLKSRQLNLKVTDFTEYNMPIDIFNCKNEKEIAVLRKHASDVESQTITPHAKQTFLELVSEQKETA
ncbi:hypothetical protein OE749_11480 [Aestuariibacter sp. AA17]|uniref:Uncharacterized protein n=1 Tax=Fluctibacter corallii TaxID=2984329 RepID=A0ABT3A9F4_9ALTE|nr:hypothetical protein [Aestuariibacter sp. AA17]MCV2885314.1 hypothetical protein [Aestuariibacter sp. AA17]